MKPRPGRETTVLIAVRSNCVREALVAMIGATEGFRVVGEAQTDEALIDLARRHQPTLALVDEDLPSSGGMWAIELLAQEGLAQTIVALGSRGDEATRRRVERVGAHAYVQAGIPPRDIVGALDAALRCSAAPANATA